MDPARTLLRHALSTIAYRGGKAVRGAPSGFAGYTIGDSTKTPTHILAHIGDLFDWGLQLAQGVQVWKDSPPLEWSIEVARFYATLRMFDDYLASDAPLKASAEQLFQGPIADALTHVGQIAMLRRLAGCPIRGENYFKADIVVSRVGPEQTAPAREFD